MGIIEVHNAISRSISHTEIVHLHSGDPAVESALSAACDGMVETVNADMDRVVECWGQDTDGDEWRVHLTVTAATHGLEA